MIGASVFAEQLRCSWNIGRQTSTGTGVEMSIASRGTAPTDESCTKLDSKLQSGGDIKMQTKSNNGARDAFWIPEDQRPSIENISHEDFHERFANCQLLLVHFESGLIYAAGQDEESIEVLLAKHSNLSSDEFVFGPGSIDIRISGDAQFASESQASIANEPACHEL